ncbi:type IV toxin-antitoxin system AbiEi family antitoxin domain-containing protein [Planctomycetota bacterium]
MKYEKLLELLGNQGFFDLASVAQLSGDRRETIRVQLHRWCRAGKLLPLRRGMYAFPESYRPGRVGHAELANALLAPSYISTYWALGFFGLIPERVVTYTSVTSRTPTTFENHFGTFTYRHVKPEAFFGYRQVDFEDRTALLAEPEKALLDLWYLEKGASSGTHRGETPGRINWDWWPGG